MRNLVSIVALASLFLSSCREPEPVISVEIDLSRYRVMTPLVTDLRAEFSVYDGATNSARSLFSTSTDLQTAGRNVTAQVSYSALPTGRLLTFEVKIYRNAGSSLLARLLTGATLPADVVLDQDAVDYLADSDSDGASDLIEILVGTSVDDASEIPLGYEDGAAPCSPACGAQDVCYDSVCRKMCTQAADCDSGETCSSNLCLP